MLFRTYRMSLRKQSFFFSTDYEMMKLNSGNIKNKRFLVFYVNFFWRKFWYHTFRFTDSIFTHYDPFKLNSLEIE